MDINLPVVAVVILASLAVVVWMIMRNKRDRRQLENKLNRNYPAPRPDKADPDPEEPLK